jgi:hypothetical protein
VGTITANIGIYIPANGEEVYGTSFAAGMQNIDLHDHSGGPNKGVPLSAASIGNGSITAVKFAGDVFFPGGGIDLDGGTNALKLSSAVLISFGNLGASSGLVVNNAGVVSATTLTSGDSNILIANGSGVGGAPTFTLASIPTVVGINATVSPLKFRIAGADFVQIQNTGGISGASRALNICPDNTNQAAIYDRCGNTGNVGAGGTSGTIFTIGTDAYQVWMISAFNFTNAAVSGFCTYMVYVNSTLFPGVLNCVKVCGTALTVADGGGNQLVLVNGTAQTASFSWTGIRLV